MTAGGHRRVLSIDAFRGFDMLWIMGFSGVVYGFSVVFPCALTATLYEQMKHVQWDGLHLMDCVYPTFLYIAGMSFPFSYAKQTARGDSPAAIHLRLVRRMLTLVFFGMVYNGFFKLDFTDFRYASVLGRIGVSWFFAALLFMHCPRKVRAALAAALLVGYWLLIGYVPAPDMPAGTDPLSLEGNFAGYVDRLFMPGRLWETAADGTPLMEPSGILENVPSVVTALFGMFCGEFLMKSGMSAARNALVLVGAAAALLAAGLLLSLDCPLNKKLWSSSFTLVNGGISTGVFAVFYWLIDVRGHEKWSFVFRVIGANSITIYMAMAVISFFPISNFFLCGLAARCGVWHEVIDPLGAVAAAWLFLYGLYRNKVFLKV